MPKFSSQEQQIAKTEAKIRFDAAVAAQEAQKQQTALACVNKAGGPLNKYGDAWCATQTKPDGTKYTRSINDCSGYCE